MIRAIVAVDDNWGIGKNNDLLFKLKTDLAYFKAQTLHGICCMGYNTMQSLPGKKPLTNRLNVVLTTHTINQPGFVQAASLQELLDLIASYEESGCQNIFIIGGGKLYSALLPYCAEVLVTKIHANGQADTFFENLDVNKNYKLTAVLSKFSEAGLDAEFCLYDNLDIKPIK